jgi:hypothetical protein
MAWRFKVLAVQPTGDAVTVRVRYFDDAAPTVILGRSVLRLPADTTRAEARAAILAEGRRLRDAYEARDRLAQDVGSEGAVT